MSPSTAPRLSRLAIAALAALVASLALAAVARAVPVGPATPECGKLSYEPNSRLAMPVASGTEAIGGEVSCTTQPGTCPRSAIGCWASVDGRVAAAPAGVCPLCVPREIGGQFSVVSVTGQVWPTGTCRKPDVCSGSTAKSIRAGDEVEGACAAVAGPYINTSTILLEGLISGHIEVGACRLSVVPKAAKRQLLRCRRRRATKAHVARSTPCETLTRRPAPPKLPKVRPTPPDRLPSNPNPQPGPAKDDPQPQPADPSAADPCDIHTGRPPCGLDIQVNGATLGGEDPHAWGMGIVTVQSAEPQPVMSDTLVGPFIAGTWSAQFNDQPGCVNGSLAVDMCHQFGWQTAQTVTLTAHATPTGGYLNRPGSGPSPAYDSQFVKWGGDCASAGTAPTCTLQIGTQATTQPGGSSNGLSVIAYFGAESVEPG